jgi:acid phosphatase type 7
VRLLCALLLFGCESTPAVTHPCPSQVTKGPWVQRVDETRATLSWESTNQGCVEAILGDQVVSGNAVETHVVGQFGAGLPKPDDPGTYYLNQIALTDLEADTCYDYFVRASGSGTQTPGDLAGRFCTARPSGKDFTFLAIGDTDPILGHTVPTLMQVLPEQPDFTVHVGDIQYYSAIAETWAYWFGAMAPLLRAGALFAAVGNHESEQATEYEDYYKRLFVPATVEMTQPWFHFSTGGVHFFALDTENTSLGSGSEQVTWLSGALLAALATPGFRFSVVFFHRPFYTVGDSDPQLGRAARGAGDAGLPLQCRVLSSPVLHRRRFRSAAERARAARAAVRSARREVGAAGTHARL